ncbi:hypothetical protein WSM22_19000 [Cytophagales bacterium WSM2-2]|nr:hypothetical protein WSM22_19000 [Cytophagales bacterium WSM2-2]
MKKFILLTALVLSCANVFATWSIIIIDSRTKEIGIAGASCTYSCYGIGRIVPNVGAIVVQAMSNSDARERGIQLMLAEASPEQIIKALRDSIFDPERQQYAVITIRHINEPATYTGLLTNTFKGTLTAEGVCVQGNTLTSETELKVIMDAVQKGKNESLSIADILMMALEAGSLAGGDRRCGEQRATSAFLTVAKPGDRHPSIDLQIFGQGKGKQNAVTLLKIKFEKWKKRKNSK